MFSQSAPMSQADAIMARLGIDQAEGLGPFLEVRIRREQVRHGHHRREAERASGVRFSGMEPDPRRPATDQELVEQARQDQAFADEWRTSPQSRFIAAILTLEELGYCAESARARAAYARGFSHLSNPPSAEEVGVAFHALMGIPSYAAKVAADALLEIAADARSALQAAE